MAQLHFHNGKMICTFGRQPNGDWYDRKRDWTDSAYTPRAKDATFTVTAAHNVRFHYGPLYNVDWFEPPVDPDDLHISTYQDVNEKWWNRVNGIPLEIDSENKR